jgi:hypothetical protein
MLNNQTVLNLTHDSKAILMGITSDPFASLIFHRKLSPCLVSFMMDMLETIESIDLGDPFQEIQGYLVAHPSC